MVGGRRAVGWRSAGAGLAWFLVATYVLAPLHAGRVTRLFETDYGITGTGPQACSLPCPPWPDGPSTPAWPATASSLPAAGVPALLGLALLAPAGCSRRPPALLLNLAAVQPEHHQLRFHYLATAAPCCWPPGRWPA